MAFNHRRKSSFIFNTQVFLLNVMFTIEIWSSRNKTLSLHSKSDPVVINPSSSQSCPKRRLKYCCQQSTIHFNNQVSASTVKPSFQHSSLFRTSSLSLNTKFFPSTFSLCSQPSRGMRPNNLQLLNQSPTFGLNFVFFLKIQRDLCRPKSFDTFEKRAPGLLAIWTLNL